MRAVGGVGTFAGGARTGSEGTGGEATGGIGALAVTAVFAAALFLLGQAWFATGAGIDYPEPVAVVGTP